MRGRGERRRECVWGKGRQWVRKGGMVRDKQREIQKGIENGIETLREVGMLGERGRKESEREMFGGREKRDRCIQREGEREVGRERGNYGQRDRKREGEIERGRE